MVILLPQPIMHVQHSQPADEHADYECRREFHYSESIIRPDSATASASAMPPDTMLFIALARP